MKIIKVLILLLTFAVPALGQYTIPSRQAIASAIPVHNPGWQWVQSNIGSATGNGVATSFTFTFAIPLLLTPLTGDTLVVYAYWSTTAISITTVARDAGETWVSPSAACQQNSSANNNAIAYTLNSVASGTKVTITFSAAPSNGDLITMQLQEYAPPSGFTPSIDGTCGKIAPVASCTSCTAASITTTSTDLILESASYANLAGNNWNSWSGTFQQEYGLANGFALDQPAGTYQPTFSQNVAGAFGAIAIAFKTTAGTYAGPPQTFSVKNLTITAASNTNCNPAPCTVTIPSTTANNALMGWIATATSGVSITNVTCGGCSAFTLPSGCAINLSGQGFQNCFYLFNIPASVTSVTITTSNGSTGASIGYEIYEMARSNGPWVFDASGSAQRAATNTPNGLAPTITGTVDAVFQSIWMPGGAGFLQWYPAPTTGPASSVCPGGCYLGSNANAMTSLNTSNTVTPVWDSNANQATAVAYFSIK